MKVVEKAAIGGSFEFVLSDETRDSYGDIVMASGWDLSRFKAGNPVALWDHGKDPEIGRKPIGRWTNVRIVKGQLLGKLDPARGVSPRIDEIIKLHELGFLPAVSVGFEELESEPIDPKAPWNGTRYTKQRLVETSLVAVPANPAALQLAKSLNISSETMSMAFGEQAEVRRKDMSATGEHAALPPAKKAPLKMKTLSQRIEDAQTALSAKKDKLTELTGADVLDVDAVEELNGQIEIEERGLAALKASEAKIGQRAVADSGVAAPAINRRPLGFPQRELSGLDLLVRRALVHGQAQVSGESIEKVLELRYPGHEATALIVNKAAAPLATTGTSGFVSELVQSTWAGFLDALRGKSIYPVLRDRGYGVSFDAAGTAYLPQLTGGGANGSFFGEGQPMRVGRVTVSAPTFTCRKMGVIIPFSREAAKRATPALESVLRRAIVDDTAKTLDTILLDATAGDTVRPAGLLNGVSAIATGSGGGDHQAVKEDFKALLAPFIAANGADGITVIMNPAQGLSIGLMDGPANNATWFSEIAKRVNIVESTYATAGRLVALRNADFATATGDMPEFEISNQATIHMEDTTPAEIVSATGPTTANPVRSFFQTDSLGLRMIMDVSWKMARSGMVQWVDTTSY